MSAALSLLPSRLLFMTVVLLASLPAFALPVYVSGFDGVRRFETPGFTGGTLISGDEFFEDARGLAILPDGDLVVSRVGFVSSPAILRYDGVTNAYEGVFAAGPELQGPGRLRVGPNGDLYVGEPDGEILRYDGATGALVDAFVVGTSVYSFEFGPDGALWLPQADRIERRDAETGALLSVFAVSEADLDLGSPLFAFTPDGSDLIAGARDLASFGEPRLLRYDVATGARTQLVDAAGFGVLATVMAFGPDGGLYLNGAEPELFFEVDPDTLVYAGTVGFVGDYTFDMHFVVPEPATAWLVLTGLFGAGVRARRARSAAVR